MIVTRKQIDPKTALEMVRHALDHGRAHGWEVAAAVYDPSGVLVAFGRTESVATPSVQFALDKAWTAAGLGKSTEAFGKRVQEKPTLALGLGARERLMVWGGGVAILHEGDCVGGIGVSGASDHEDIACAEAAIAALGFRSR
jgi:uncharacterized protein GlcG (DUF336 family)